MNFIFDPSLVLYLPFYELNGTSFMSKDAYGHSCSAVGASWRPNGRYFDGNDDWINLPNDFDIFTGYYTVILWIQPASLAANAMVADFRGERQLYILILSPGNIRFAKKVTTWYSLETTIAPLSAGNFGCIACVQKSDGRDIFCNGEIMASDSNISTPDATSNQNRLGADCYGTNDFNGTIALALLYRRALAPAEIKNIYLSNKGRYR